MAWEQIASGGLLDATELGGYEETYIAEGQRGLLQLDLRLAVSPSVANLLQSQLQQRGVSEAQVSTDSPVLNISWRRGFPWLAVIVAIILGLIALAILIAGWRFYREIVQDLGPTGGWLFIAAVLGLVVVGATALKRRG